MVSGPGSLALKRRMQRLELIKNLLSDLNGENFEKATAVIMYNTGLTKYRLSEYLEILEKIEFFTVENGKIKILSQDRRWSKDQKDNQADKKNPKP